MKLKNIVNCDDSVLCRVLSLRNTISIKQNMYSDHDITWQEHLCWVNSLRTDDLNKVFVVFNNDKAIGLASINKINKTHRHADWAFYLDPETQGKGLGAALEFAMIDYAFFRLNLEKLNCQVLDFNETVITMHKKFGFEVEGVIRSQIKKEIRVDVVILGITKEEWEEKRESMTYVTSRIKSKIEISDERK